MKRQLPDWSTRVIWYSWTARWGWILLAAIVLAWEGNAASARLLGLSLYALGQLVLTFFMLASGRTVQAGKVGLGLDLVASLAVLALSAGQPLILIVLLLAPAGSAAFHFGAWRGFGIGLLLGALLLALSFSGIVEWRTEGISLLQVALPYLVAQALAVLAADRLADYRPQGLLAAIAPTADLPAVARELADQLPASELPMEGEQLLMATLDLGLEVLTATGLDSSKLSGLALMCEANELREAGRERLAEVDPIRLEPVEGALALARQRGTVQNIARAQEDPDLAALAAAVGWGSAACLPVDDGKRCLGLLLFGHSRTGAFDVEKLEGLHALGQQARLALRFAEMYQEQVQQRIRLGEIQEEARKKLARDLHDGPTQVIAAIAMRTNFARRQLGRDPQAADQELEKVEAMARSTTKEIRHMLFTLRPLILESQGLVAALRQFAEKVQDTHDQKVLVSAEPKLEMRLSQASQVALFYIVEEAVTNAYKHAAAEHIWVDLSVESDRVQVEIADDGVGFNVGEVDAHYEQRGSLGMVTMRERAELLDGGLEIESELGRGTTIRAWIPCDQTPREDGSG